MPCNTRDYTQVARERAVSALKDRIRLAAGTVTATNVDVATGEITFSASTDDGFTLTGIASATGEVIKLTLDGWALADRAGWCDECVFARLKDTLEVAALGQQAAQVAQALAVYGGQALYIGQR